MEPANDWGKNERVSSTNNNVHIVDFVARIQAPRFLHHPCLFHSIRNSIGVADWARSLKLCIYSYICICILHTYIYIYIFHLVLYGGLNSISFPSSISHFFSSHALFPLSLNKLCSGSRRLLRANWKIVYSVLCERRTVRTKIDGRTLNSSSKIGRCSLFIISVANTIRILRSKPVFPLLWPSSG